MKAMKVWGSMRKIQQLALIVAAAGGLSTIGAGVSIADAPAGYNGVVPSSAPLPTSPGPAPQAAAPAPAPGPQVAPQAAPRVAPEVEVPQVFAPQPAPQVNPQFNPQVDPLINPLISPNVPQVNPFGLGHLAAPLVGQVDLPGTF
ncbi:hypothetical protein ACIQU6_37760 [Streptomyces sp. NPDC090442]|uniref:hypothetical protein n=1 Tax=Streptomyces sp. NPDC090442 TaxID=3365962 RepID=UPI0037F37962